MKRVRVHAQLLFAPTVAFVYTVEPPNEPICVTPVVLGARFPGSPPVSDLKEDRFMPASGQGMTVRLETRLACFLPRRSSKTCLRAASS
jgi:hypothetical protein